MRTIATEELKKILEEHEKWLENPMTGKKAFLHNADLRGANLSGAYLYNADLRGADLRSANLWGADLSGADLHNADLRGANLSGAYLYNADLRGADLRSANLWGADLSGANLRGADLRSANLRGADLHNADLRSANLRGADLHNATLIGADLSGAKYRVPLTCPEEGGFTGWKIASIKPDGSRDKLCVIKLHIPASAKRSSATGRKCRANKAKVISITSIDGSKKYETAHSKYDPDFIYRVGEYVEVENFDDNRFNECAPGIHFFITRQEAVAYGG